MGGFTGAALNYAKTVSSNLAKSNSSGEGESSSKSQLKDIGEQVKGLKKYSSGKS